MGIWALNSATDDNKIDYEIYHEHVANGIVVPRLSGTILIPKATSPHQWTYMWLACDADGGNAKIFLGLLAPVGRLSRLIGAWGTEPRSTARMLQQQVDRIVTFRGDFDFDQEFGQGGSNAKTTKGAWVKRSPAGAWPFGKCAAIYLRLEAGRGKMDGTKTMQTAQINVGSGGDGSKFKTQGKGIARLNETGDISHDFVRLPLDRANKELGVMISEWNKGTILFSGFELVPT
jgi:hypothetical protein